MRKADKCSIQTMYTHIHTYIHTCENGMAQEHSPLLKWLKQQTIQKGMFLVQTIKRNYKGFGLRTGHSVTSIVVLLLPIDTAVKKTTGMRTVNSGLLDEG